MEQLSPTPKRPGLTPRRRSYSYDSAELEFKLLSKTSHLEISALQSLAARLFLLEDQVNPLSSLFHERNEADVIKLEKGEQEKLKKCTEEIIASVLLENLNCKRYDVDLCTQQTISISKKVEEQMKMKVLKEDEKVLAVVYVGEACKQGIQVTCQCLWDPQKDFMASASFCVNNLFAVCYAFVIR